MIRVLIVNEYRLMCNVLAAALEDEPDILVAGRATHVTDALAKVENQEFDVVIVSARLPDNGALKLTDAITQREQDINILILGLSETREQVLKFVEAGASGYILKNDSVEDLISAIHAAYQGKAIVSPEIAAALMSRVTELAQFFSDIENEVVSEAGLTEREVEVLELIGQNLTNQEIADRLFIEVGTVKNHVHNILNKLDVSSRGDAVAYLAILKK